MLPLPNWRSKGRRCLKGDVAGAERRQQRTQQLMDRLPALVGGYERIIERGLKQLTDPVAISQARDALKTLIVGGRLALQPNGDHTKVIGTLRLVDLGEHALQLAGLQRRRAGSGYAWNNGSGGRI
jgi:hypothetical protein